MARRGAFVDSGGIPRTLGDKEALQIPELVDCRGLPSPSVDIGFVERLLVNWQAGYS